MEIVVEGGSERPIRILIPTGLALNRVSAAVISSELKKKNVKIPPARLYRLFREIRKYKRRHSEWTLVDVQRTDGEHVTVKL